VAKGEDIVVIGAKRTPMGHFGGTLKDVPVYELGKLAIQGVLANTKILPEEIDEVIGGNARQAGNGPNPVRTAARMAGIAASIPAVTINNACPSSMKALIMMAQNLRLGDVKTGMVVGMESLSTIPYLVKGIRWHGLRLGDHLLQDGWGDSVDPFVGFGMGITAENVAQKYGITRMEQDEFALASHSKAAQAQDNGWFDDEIIQIEVPGEKGKPAILFSKDESIRRDTNLEKMAALKPCFKKDGSVTAANSCGMTDGASSMIVTTRHRAEELKAKPLFRIVSYATAAVENAYMGEGPGISIPLALGKAGLNLCDMDLIEVNEAFAAQVISNERMLKWDRNKLNVHGGAIALGHPPGCSGIRIVITAYHALKRLNKEFAVCAICGGGGPTCAVIIQVE
jgi:acetyl-CoA C-acetyltransferase